MVSSPPLAEDNSRSPKDPVSTNTWSMFWQVLVPGTQTVTVTKPSLAAKKVCGSGPESTMIGSTLFAAPGFTVTIVFPDLLVSCDEVAVIVTCVGEDTTGAVNSPEDEIEPALAVQVTSLLKFPVPVTVAEH